jgi:hypothetical protein
MDVDSLKAELEEHLAKNPDADAPHGFRDRFQSLTEQYQAEGGEIPKSVWEGELQRVRNEAEAAWKCADPSHDHGPAARAEARETPAAPASDARADETVNPPVAGFMQRYGIALIVAVVVLAGAWYFFRR